MSQCYIFWWRTFMNPVLVGSKVICSLLSCFVFVVVSFKHAGDHHLEVDKIDKQLFHIFKVCCFKYKSFINWSFRSTFNWHGHQFPSCYRRKSEALAFQLVWSVSFPRCSHIVSWKTNSCLKGFVRVTLESGINKSYLMVLGAFFSVPQFYLCCFKL